MITELIDYARPLTNAEQSVRRCYEALEEDKDLDAAQREVETLVRSARAVLLYIDTQRNKAA
jgi:hypothetical protein